MKKTYIKTITVLSLAFTYMLMLYAPLEVFLSNTTEFWFDIFDLLSIVVPCFLVAITMSVVIGILLFKLMYGRADNFLCLIICGVFSVFLAMYVQGNYIPRDYGLLNGTPIDFSQFKSYGIASLIIWPLILLLCIGLFVIVVLVKKNRDAFCKFIMYIAIAVMIMLSVGLVSLFPSAKKLINDQELVVTNNGEFDVTSDKNIIVFVLDTFDGNYFRELLEEDESKYANMLQDFTFYENSLGGYNATQFSVPLMLTGEWFEYQQDWNEFIEDAYAKTPLFSALKDNNYKVGIYLDMPVSMSKDVSLYDNCTLGKYRIAYKKDFATILYKLIMFEYMPQQMKGRFIVSTEYFDQLKTLGSDDEDTFYDTDDVFYKNLSENGLNVVGDGNTFKYVHLKGMHLGHMLDENLIEDGEVHTRQEAEHGCMKEIELLLEELKKNSIYDNSAIVIMADHGGVEENASYLASCPLLLYKGFNEHHDFEINSDAISWEQINPTFVSLVTGIDDDRCIWNSHDKNNARRFLHHPLVMQNPPLEEYEVTGNVADGTAEYKTTGKIFELVVE